MVEWRELWEVTTWDKKFIGVHKHMQPKVIKYHYYLANELSELEETDGDIRILYTTEKVAYTNSEKVKSNIHEGEIVAIPWGGNPSVKYYKGKFITADNRIATSNNTELLDNKYLYYWMQSQLDTIASFYRGAGIKHPSMLSVLLMPIPIPSKEEQARIVSILDTFTDSITNLDAQIKARRKQYEYYRDQLLDLEGKDGVEMKILKDLAIIMNGKDYKKLSDGNIPVYGTGGIMAYVDTFAYDKPSVLLPRKGSVEKIYYVTNPFWTVDTIYWTIIKTEIILPKFLYHALCKYDLKDYSYGGGIPSLSQKILYGLTIPLPSLQEQSRIVSILDQFEESIKNLEAQYELRKKQYEYYRNQLLSFE